MTDVQIAQRIMRILLSPAAQKLDFKLGSIHVDGAGLRSVYAALWRKTLGYGGIGARVGKMSPGAAASYNNGDDEFIVPTSNFGSTPVERMHIVHESIHAMQDIAGGTQYSPRGSIYTSETENEAAAYVGGALFSLYDTGAVYGGHPHATAFRIAQSIQNVKGARVSDTDATILRTAVWMHPVYFFDGVSMWSPTFADGLGS